MAECGVEAPVDGKLSLDVVFDKDGDFGSTLMGAGFTGVRGVSFVGDVAGTPGAANGTAFDVDGASFVTEAGPVATTCDAFFLGDDPGDLSGTPPVSFFAASSSRFTLADFLMSTTPSRATSSFHLRMTALARADTFSRACLRKRFTTKPTSVD